MLLSLTPESIYLTLWAMSCECIIPFPWIASMYGIFEIFECERKKERERKKFLLIKSMCRRCNNRWILFRFYVDRYVIWSWNDLITWKNLKEKISIKTCVHIRAYLARNQMEMDAHVPFENVRDMIQRISLIRSENGWQRRLNFNTKICILNLSITLWL